jgi:hypothetical protein
LARTLASPYLGHKPKVKVTTTNERFLVALNKYKTILESTIIKPHIYGWNGVTNAKTTISPSRDNFILPHSMGDN